MNLVKMSISLPKYLRLKDTSTSQFDINQQSNRVFDRIDRLRLFFARHVPEQLTKFSFHACRVTPVLLMSR